MSKVKVKVNSAGVRELLKSGGVQRELSSYANRMYGSVSGIEGYALETRIYPERCGYAILAKDYPAIADNLSNNTLLRISGA